MAYEIIALCIFCASASGHVSAAEIKCLFPLAFKSSLSEVVPQFEKSTGDKVAIDYATIGALTARLKKGEIADVAILSSEQFTELQQEGKLLANTRTDVAKLGDGAFVRRGAPKPDISSVEAFKRTLLAVKAITYIDPAAGAPSGIYMAKLMERLAIGGQMNAKTRLAAGSGKALFDIVSTETPKSDSSRSPNFWRNQESNTWGRCRRPSRTIRNTPPVSSLRENSRMRERL
jgi:molybdate transport system substrate-binding protein